MNLDQYQLKSDKSEFVFEFTSIGVKGKIDKIARFDEVEPGIYNLILGDKDPVTNRINDIIVSNNGDTEKVLATVASAVYAFTGKYADAWIYATGSTRSRNRLYRIGINKHLTEVQKV